MLTYGHLIEDLKTASKQLLITVSSLLNFVMHIHYVYSYQISPKK